MHAALILVQFNLPQEETKKRVSAKRTCCTRMPNPVLILRENLNFEAHILPTTFFI